MAWIFARGGEGQPTYYFDGMGHVQIVTGNRPWRNSNPGDLGYGPFAQHRGAIGTDGDLAIFPDYQTGREAMKKRLFGDDYAGTYYYGDNYPDYYNMTIEHAIEVWAPRSENNTDLKILQVCWWTDLDSDTELWELTAEEQEAFCDAIMRMEGYNNDVNLRGRYNTFISPFDLACHEQLLSCHQSFTAATTMFDPIVVDLDGDGVETTSLTDGAYFDHDSNGFAEQTGWASPDDGLLA